MFEGELKQSLPSMVVEILETKLDDDYIEYIANMMAKKTSDDNLAEDPEPDSRAGNWEEKSDESRKNPMDWPSHWEYMDPRQVCELFLEYGIFYRHGTIPSLIIYLHNNKVL